VKSLYIAGLSVMAAPMGFPEPALLVPRLAQMRQKNARFYKESAPLPDWPNSDYETIYMFHITRPDNGGTPHATLESQKKDLGNTLKDTCPDTR
jgi:hypothetical protein